MDRGKNSYLCLVISYLLLVIWEGKGGWVFQARD